MWYAGERTIKKNNVVALKYVVSVLNLSLACSCRAPKQTGCLYGRSAQSHGGPRLCPRPFAQAQQALAASGGGT